MIVALIAGVATSIASAEPREERGGRVPFTEPQSRTAPPRVGDWIRLATPTPTRFGTEWIVLGRSSGAFRMLRIESTSGVVHLRTVQVEFTTGKSASFNVEQWLDVRHPSAVIDFGMSRFIDHVVVTTTRAPAGTYVIFGSWSIPPSGDLVARR